MTFNEKGNKNVTLTCTFIITHSLVLSVIYMTRKLAVVNNVEQIVSILVILNENTKEILVSIYVKKNLIIQNLKNIAKFIKILLKTK